MHKAVKVAKTKRRFTEYTDWQRMFQVKCAECVTLKRELLARMDYELTLARRIVELEQRQ